MKEQRKPKRSIYHNQKLIQVGAPSPEVVIKSRKKQAELDLMRMPVPNGKIH